MSDRERVEALAKVCWLMDGGDPEWGWDNLTDDQRDFHRDQADVLLSSPAMRDLLAEAKADALREAAEAVTLYGEPTITEMVRAWLRDRATAANPYRETSNGGRDE